MVVDEMGACASVVAASPTCSVAEIFQSVINDGGIESYENVHVKRAGNYSIFFLAPTWQSRQSSIDKFWLATWGQILTQLTTD